MDAVFDQALDAAINLAMCDAEIAGLKAAAAIREAQRNALPSNWHAHLASCRRVGPEPRMSKRDADEYKADQRYDAMKCGELV